MSAERSLGDVVGVVVKHVVREEAPFVIAARALHEGLRRYPAIPIETKMEIVTAFGPVHAIVDLIGVLDAVLRSIAVRPKEGTESALIHVDAGKLIEAWK